MDENDSLKFYSEASSYIEESPFSNIYNGEL